MGSRGSMVAKLKLLGIEIRIFVLRSSESRLNESRLILNRPKISLGV